MELFEQFMGGADTVHSGHPARMWARINSETSVHCGFPALQPPIVHLARKAVRTKLW
ncbi:hypothetical protein ACWDKQ_00105 [Saccharopolyspora sp. NPDC000995]